jgi:2-oxoglutarate ferredoxin oxidoreductase subunit gamma
MENERYEIRFSGSGGQGILMAALVLAEAAGVYDGKHVCQTQSYGPEARGGSSQADVVISREEIDYPKAMKLDMLVAMNQVACNTHFSALKPDGLLVVDSSLVEQTPTDRVVAIPFTPIARKEVGKELVANMVALGAVAFLCREVSLKKLEAALSARVPPKTVDMNLKALRAGARAAKKVSLGALPQSVIREEIEL